MFSRVILDANVLFPGSLRDTLLRIAEGRLVEVHWTAEILEEMRRNLIAKGEMTEVQAQKLVMAMQAAFPDAGVASDYQRHIPSLTNDPKDRHVLAAAIEVGADSIVTFNIRDFPAES